MLEAFDTYEEVYKIGDTFSTNGLCPTHEIVDIEIDTLNCRGVITKGRYTIREIGTENTVKVSKEEIQRWLIKM